MVNEHPLPVEIAQLLLATEQLPDYRQTFLATLQTLIGPRGARPGMALTADHLSQIDQPSLLIFAANDPFGAAEVGLRVAHALPNALLHVVDGGHTPWLHHADQIATLVTGWMEPTG